MVLGFLLFLRIIYILQILLPTEITPINPTQPLTVCDVLKDLQEYRGKIVQIRGRWNGPILEGRACAPLKTGDYEWEWQPAVGSENEQKFTSYQRDSESGLDYAIHRFDATARGVFMSVDPGPVNLMLPQSLNRYIYAMADPVNYTDPSGLSRETPVPPPTLPISWPGWMTLLADARFAACGSSPSCAYNRSSEIPPFPRRLVTSLFARNGGISGTFAPISLSIPLLSRLSRA